MRVELSYDGPLVNVRRNITGGRIKVEAQRGETGKVYSAIAQLMDDHNQFTTDPHEWISVYADDDFLMYVSMIPDTIRHAMIEAVTSLGPNLLREHQAERDGALEQMRKIDKERLEQRRLATVQLLRRIDRELASCADGEGFNSCVEQ